MSASGELRDDWSRATDTLSVCRRLDTHFLT